RFVRRKMATDIVLSIPGRGNTYFYFTNMGKDGFSREQQREIAALIRSYRERYPKLEIPVVQDFGMEEGTRFSGKKYGDFAACRDNAVYNADLHSISYNHIRVSKMPADLSPEDLQSIMDRYETVKLVSGEAAGIRAELMNRGTPPPRIDEEIRRAARGILARQPERCRPSGTDAHPGCIDPGPHNGLPLEDPCFADVWAVRQLEETMSVRRLTVHELGHAISETYAILKEKKIKKLFSTCRDGFENLDEFCAECFMASEYTGGIPLAARFASILAEKL
ncbi:MAG: hypothetical protein Q4D81_07940, partial [Eubacteriales bacterium]|nr:hypothetical protein [Eubacteriales bacterium]